jgi:hypothetical protein
MVGKGHTNMQKVLTLVRLTASTERSEAVLLEPGTEADCLESRIVSKTAYLKLSVGGVIYNLKTPVQYVVFVPREFDPPPCFKKIKLKCNLSVISAKSKRRAALAAGTELDVSILSPNVVDSKEYTFVCADNNGQQFYAFGITRPCLNVLEGVEEAMSVWDDDVFAK